MKTMVYKKKLEDLRSAPEVAVACNLKKTNNEMSEMNARNVTGVSCENYATGA